MRIARGVLGVLLPLLISAPIYASLSADDVVVVYNHIGTPASANRKPSPITIVGDAVSL